MKNYVLSNEMEQQLLANGVTDSLSDNFFKQGDSVVICKRCNAITLEKTWKENGGLCEICEGSELLDFSQQYLESYKSDKEVNNGIIPDQDYDDLYHMEDTSYLIKQLDVDEEKPAKPKKKNKFFKKIKILLITLIILSTLVGIATAIIEYKPEILDDLIFDYIDYVPETNDEPDEPEPDPAPVVSELNIPSTEEKLLDVDESFKGTPITIKEAEPKVYTGYISSDEPVNQFTFTAPRSGRYNFAIEDMMATASTILKVYDKYGNCVINSYSDSESTNLEGKKTYKIEVIQYSGESSFNLVIGIQNKTTDISASSEILDRISFSDQINNYTFTAPISGVYYFGLSEVNASTSFKLALCDEKNNVVANDNGTDAEINPVLHKGKTYSLRVEQYEETGSYQLNVGFHKPEQDISGYTAVVDSVEFKGQLNCYYFTPNVSGRYRIDLTETSANNTYDIKVYDHLDNAIGYNDDSGVTLDLNKGETYTICLVQDEGFGPYTLRIGYQKPKTDISDYEIINDSVDFAEQINKYKFVAPATKEYTVSLSNYNSGNSVQLLLIDEYDNVLFDLYDESEPVNLEAGKEYTIKVCQATGLGSYTLGIS